MRINKVILMLACGVSALAQSKPIMGWGIGNRVGDIAGETRIEPPSPTGTAQHIRGGISGSKDGWFRRSMIDDGQKKYFGYDLLLEPHDQNTFRLTFRPPTEGPEKAGIDLLPLPVYPAPQIVHYGDTIALDLMINPATGQKIVDYLVVHRDPAPANPFAGPPRDFKAEDVELRFMDTRVAINERNIDSVNGPDGFTGANSWFYLAGHGRFFLSLSPKDGFSKAGEVRGGKLSFTVLGNRYVLSCSEKIAPGSDAYNLYIRHEANYQPNNSSATFFHAASR